jgi:5-methylcytosine-specific restriction protein A
LNKAGLFLCLNIMPIAPKRPCPAPGCRALVVSGYCAQHKRDVHRRYHAASQSHQENNRFYASSAWRKARRLQLEAEPMCRHCRQEKKLTEATHVDHIIPREHGGADFDPANLQSLCKPHHEAKSQRDRVKYGRGSQISTT